MRVLVTRAEEDAPALAEALRGVGAEPVIAPMIARRIDVDAVRAGLDAWPAPDVLLLTSAAAARALAGARTVAFRPARVAAVGPATAKAAAEAGLPVDVLPDEATGTAAVAALGDLRGRTVLYVQAAASVPSTRAALAAAGARIVDVVAYTTGSHPDRVAALRAAGPVDLVTLASPSTARSYVEAAREAGLALAPAVVTGPTTAAACGALGVEVRAIAEPHTAEGLVAAVARLRG
jgi:uroporphyrinogen-III synthase